ncbi:papilin-like [Ixodes scapularis]|uniref:papilin-like n=1 Tax=Ixodes scapularis TaxID=6945 RepID=UPI001A9E5CFF|nr:papilin-like [Ixodes scapularis]
MMLFGPVWMLALAGICSCSGLADEKVDVCALPPEVAGDGSGFEAWYYDTNVGKCSKMFSKHTNSRPGLNRFDNETQCNVKCRPDVPSFCFEKLDNGIRQGSKSMWTYNSDLSQCVQFQWSGGETEGKNVFRSNQDCLKKCEIPDLGDCSMPPTRICKRNDDEWYRFDQRTHTCRPLEFLECPNREGNTFGSFYGCNQRCGRFVRNKCGMPIQNMSICATVSTRYGYNAIQQMCEEFQGCDDGGNSFPSAEMCWKTCAQNTRSPCVMPPDFNYYGFFSRYYYDIKTNRCQGSSISGKGVPGNTNLFWSMEDCKKTCIAKHQPGMKY